jgi:hypothetical protein
MARLPNNPSLLVMYASFMIEARKDGQAARTQLQLAQKASPSTLDNYSIYVAQQLAKKLTRGRTICLHTSEKGSHRQQLGCNYGVKYCLYCSAFVSRQFSAAINVTWQNRCASRPSKLPHPLFEPAADDGLDLLSYVEFQRNYLAAVRMHKAALMAQRGFWNSLLRDTVSFRDLQVCIRGAESYRFDVLV